MCWSVRLAYLYLIPRRTIYKSVTLTTFRTNVLVPDHHHITVKLVQIATCVFIDTFDVVWLSPCHTSIIAKVFYLVKKNRGQIFLSTPGPQLTRSVRTMVGHEIPCRHRGNNRPNRCYGLHRTLCRPPALQSRGKG